MALVAGSAVEHHGLLVVPREGGRAELRALTDPGRVEWSGRTELPAATEVRAAGRVVLLRAADGTVHRYDPARDRLGPVGEVSANARWIAAARGGAFVGSHGVLAVTETGERSIETAGPPLWAAPIADGRVVGLLEVNGRVRAVSWPADGSEPSTSSALPVRPPALAAGWGSTLVAATAGDGVAAYGLAGFEQIESLELGGPVTALAISPSSHRLYVAIGGRDGELAAIDRFGWRVERLRGVDGPVRDLRVSVLGDYLLVLDGSETRVVDIDGGSAATGLAWGDDLPIGLPGRRVLGRRGEALVLVAREGEATPVPDSTPSWWVAIPWAPARPVTDVVADAEAGGGDGRSEDEGAEESRSVGLGTATRPIGAADAPRVATATPRAGREAAPAADEASIPPGFYAVAASARQIEGVRSLQRTLEGAGYPSHIFARRDEANDLWYRVMVGPYGSREAADAIARRLRGERGIRAWIREVPPGGAIGTRAGLP